MGRHMTSESCDDAELSPWGWCCCCSVLASSWGPRSSFRRLDGRVPPGVLVLAFADLTGKKRGSESGLSSLLSPKRSRVSDIFLRFLFFFGRPSLTWNPLFICASVELSSFWAFRS